VFNHPPQFSRAKHFLQGKPDATGRLTIIYQTCGHMHDSRDAALACDFGGEFLYERRAETFEQLSEADQHRNEEWSYEFAEATLARAFSDVEPDEPFQPGWSMTKRGNRFDVLIGGDNHLYDEYEAAIRKAFGSRLGTIRCSR
jgi:hypothetical protein